MKTALLAYVVGLLLVVVFSAEKSKCGCNMTTTSCAPCSPICGQEPRACPLYCIVNATFCVCKPNYCLPRANSKFCVPIKSNTE